MDANDDKGNLGGYLSQLKRSVSKLLAQSGRDVFLYGVAAFFVGTGTLGNLPPIALSKADQGQETALKQDQPASSLSTEEELCLWKRDLAFFSRLGEEDLYRPETVDCSQDTDQEEKEGGNALSSEEKDAASLIDGLVAGYPIEAMTDSIAKYDRDIAGLIIGIAKKESNWGKRVPRASDGSDCFNYWGYKGAGSRGIAMGHGCFGSPEEAVQAVGNRLTELVAKRNADSDPKNMIVWKCGSSCAGHSPESVKKWISDVEQYYRQIARN